MKWYSKSRRLYMDKDLLKMFLATLKEVQHNITELSKITAKNEQALKFIGVALSITTAGFIGWLFKRFFLG